MPNNSPIENLKSFPWASLGRREWDVDFFQMLEEQKKLIPLLKAKPIFSSVTEIHSGHSLKRLKEFLSAFQLQSYPHWEVILYGSQKLPELKKYAHQQKDSRIRWIDMEESPSPLWQTNKAAQQAKGTWVLFPKVENILSPAAFYCFAKTLHEHPLSTLLYCNEAFLSPNNKTIESFYSKPELSWFNLIHFNYLGDFWALKKECFDALEGFQSESNPSHDLLLRHYEYSQDFELVSYFLYYRRDNFTFHSDKSSLEPVNAHLDRKKFDSTVSTESGRVRVIPQIDNPEEHLVSAILCFKDHADWTLQCLNSLLQQVGQVPLEIFLINNQSSASELAKVQNGLPRTEVPIRILHYDKPFNFSHMQNWAAESFCRGRYLLLINNDVFWKGLSNLDEMVAWAQFPWAGTVGILLRFPDGKIQHGGFRGVFGGFSRIARIHHAQTEKDFLLENREVFGNTFAACLVRKELFEEIGGLRDLHYPNGQSDVAFNFECVRRGLHNLYLGNIEAIHQESGSRGIRYEYWEECGIEKEYPDILQRMLRYDLGFDRIPNEKISLKQFLKSGLATQIIDKLGGLGKLRPSLKAWASRILSEA